MPRYAEEYGYRSGTILGGSGHMRVSVSPGQVSVEYVASAVSANESSDRKNCSVADSYTLPVR